MHYIRPIHNARWWNNVWKPYYIYLQHPWSIRQRVAIKVPWPYIATTIWRCRKNFSQLQCSFQWKLRPHWLKFLRPCHIAVVIQGLEGIKCNTWSQTKCYKWCYIACLLKPSNRCILQPSNPVHIIVKYDLFEFFLANGIKNMLYKCTRWFMIFCMETTLDIKCYMCGLTYTASVIQYGEPIYSITGPLVPHHRLLWR